MKRIIVSLVLLFICHFGFAQLKVGLYWDASYSMRDRDLNREMVYLANFIKKYPNVDMNLVVFSNEILFESTFTIRDGQWTYLKQELANTIYDGNTNYSSIWRSGLDMHLLFTDGQTLTDPFEPPTDKPLYIVTSSSNADFTN